MHRFTDIHTHRAGLPDSVLSIPAAEVVAMERQQAGLLSSEGLQSAGQLQFYSLQLHPWHLTGQSDIEDFVACALAHQADPRFVAIGECGLDPLCQVALPLQHEAFLAALRVAKELRKPVVIHCVRLWDQLLADVSLVFTMEERLKSPLIIHGFRKGPQLARQLLDAGFSISLGKYYNEATRQIVPAERLYFETDET